MMIGVIADTMAMIQDGLNKFRIGFGLLTDHKKSGG